MSSTNQLWCACGRLRLTGRGPFVLARLRLMARVHRLFGHPLPPADHRPEREATAPRITEPTQEASA